MGKQEDELEASFELVCFSQLPVVQINLISKWSQPKHTTASQESNLTIG